jgi:hypothetical protein
MVAHTLAKHAMRYNEVVVECFECPQWVRNIVEIEAQHFFTSDSSGRRPEGLPVNCTFKLMKASIRKKKTTEQNRSLGKAIL